jgi:hypothetical protein
LHRILFLDLLWYEWIDNLALRRVYFLESNHYRSRIEELDEITAIRDTIPEDPFQLTRPPFLPDPELRDTPPSIGLYSVLYQLPESLITFGTDGATTTERQLVATVNFFDECVPPQPGFSSSVAAVTIIPDAGRVAKAWIKWHLIEAKVRRLRYIRKVLREKLEGVDSFHQSGTNSVRECTNLFAADTTTEKDVDAGPVLTKINNVQNDDHDPTTPKVQNSTITDATTRSSSPTLDGKIGMDPSASIHEGSIEDVRKGGRVSGFFGGYFGGSHQPSNSHPTDDIDEVDVESASLLPGDDTTTTTTKEMLRENEVAATVTGNNEEELRVIEIIEEHAADQKHFEYADFDVLEYARKLGFDEETTLVDIVDGLGIEELTVFAKEYSLSSANPCMYGVAHELLGFATIEELRDLEEEAWQDLRDANEQLIAAREAVVDGKNETHDEGSRDHSGQGGLDHENSYDDLVIVSPVSTDSAGLRNRVLNASSEVLKNQWEQAQQVAIAMKLVRESDSKHQKRSKWRSFIPCFGSPLKALPKYYGQVQGVGKAFLTALDHPTYAVVSFTSRQAAVAGTYGNRTDQWQST